MQPILRSSRPAGSQYDLTPAEVDSMFSYLFNITASLNQLILVPDDAIDTVSLLNAAAADIEISINNAAYQNLITAPGWNFKTGKFDVADYNYAAGYFKFRKKAVGQTPPGDVITSPAFTKSTSIPIIWQNKKWTAMGDSITAQLTSYAAILSQLLGAILTNIAQSGATISNGNGQNGDIYTKVSQIPLDTELLTNNGGVNDFRTNVPLGTISDNTTGTFYGALKLTMAGMRQRVPNATIVWFNMYGSSAADVAGTWKTPNGNGNTQAQFKTAIQEVAAVYNIKVVDMSLAGIGEDDGAFYTSDGLHLSDTAGGSKKYADYAFANVRNHQDTATGTVAKPVFNPAQGNYLVNQSIAMSSSTPGAAVKYTTDGSTPTDASTTYGSPVLVSQNMILKAIATKSGMTSSAVTTGNYMIYKNLLHFDTATGLADDNAGTIEGGGQGGYDNRGVSSKVLANGNAGSLYYLYKAGSSFVILGLNDQNTNVSFNQYKVCFYVDQNGLLTVRDAGGPGGVLDTLGVIPENTLLKIVVSGTAIKLQMSTNGVDFTDVFTFVYTRQGELRPVISIADGSKAYYVSAEGFN